MPAAACTARPRRPRSSRREGLAVLAVSLALAAGAPPPAAIAEDTRPNKPVPEAIRRAEIERPSRGRPAGLPRDIGEILEITDTARQTGLGSVRLVRRAGDALYDWLRHLRISIAENDLSDIAYDRDSCQLLYEVAQQACPSAILGDGIRSLRQEIGRGARGDPTTAFLHLQLAIEKYRQLYPLHDLDVMAAAVMNLQRDGKAKECEEALDVLLAAIMLPNLDGPIQRSFETYQLGLTALDRGDRGEARRLIKDAAGYISHLSVGSYLAEASWFLTKADIALLQGRGALAVASLRDADSLLRTAEERSWKEFRPLVKAVREDSRRLLGTLDDRDKKGTLTTGDVRALARRIDRELRIPA